MLGSTTVENRSIYNKTRFYAFLNENIYVFILFSGKNVDFPIVLKHF